MTKITTDKFDRALIALADPTRREIIKQLSNKELRVTELAEPFDVSLNAISKHIKMLERAGLVNRRIDGRDHFLTFNPEPLDETLAWMNSQRDFWNSRLDMLEALLKEEDKQNEKKEMKKKKRGREKQ